METVTVQHRHSCYFPVRSTIFYHNLAGKFTTQQLARNLVGLLLADKFIVNFKFFLLLPTSHKPVVLNWATLTGLTTKFQVGQPHY